METLFNAVPKAKFDRMKQRLNEKYGELKQSSQKEIDATKEKFSKFKAEVRKYQREVSELLENDRSRHQEELTQRDDFIASLYEKARNHGLDLESILKKENKNVGGKPVVPSSMLAKPEHFKEKVEKFKRYVEDINAQERLKPEKERNLVLFSEQQEDMIFCSNRSACVLAGAGSGKSTSLVLRVIFFIKFLDVPIENITVCTFTVESRKDFINKLKERCTQFDIPISHKEAKTTVRTFHSLAFMLNKLRSGEGKDILFDFEHQIPKDDEGVDIDNQYEFAVDKTGSVPKPVKMQLSLCKKLYTQDETFRDKVNALYLASLKRKIKEYNAKPFNDYFDDVYSKTCLEIWKSRYEQIERVLLEFSEDATITIGASTLRYHLRLPTINAFVFLGVAPEQFGEERIDVGKYSKSLKLYSRERITLIATCSTDNYFVVNTIEELLGLVSLERQGSNPCLDTLTLPEFEYCSQGDFLSKNKEKNNIVYKMSSAIEFSYAIGIPLYRLEQAELLKILDFSKCSSSDKDFIQASWIFHKAWMKELDDHNLTTFNDVFFAFSDPKHQAYIGTLDFGFNKLTHLMVDEFQDIAPNIIGFLRQIKRYLTSIDSTVNPMATGSLTCVGDDFQSIYGWRGSSAHFITQFEEHFTTAQEAETVKLEENYRSALEILEIGQKVTDKIKVKSDKTYISKTDLTGNSPHGCWIYSAKENSLDYDKAAEVLQEVVDLFKPTPEKPIYVLYKSISYKVDSKGSEWNKKIAKYSKVIKFLTIHSSKGLEADCVLVLGDLNPPELHPIRESFYSIAEDIAGTYYEMQLDECYRLAYVAITRARYQIHWFFSSNKPDRNLAHYLLR
ncbi:hypothetical protein EOE71_16605 [Vibrio cholerae]|nr:hypothetical protein [Vibrio cholerae]